MKHIKKVYDGYNLHIIKTDRFKTVNVRMDYITKRDKKTSVYMEFLEGILTYATKEFPTRLSLTKAIGNMYDLRWRTNNVAWAGFNNFQINLNFVNEKYTKKNMNKKSISFFLKQIFNPLSKNGGFDKEIFEMFKKIIIDDLESIKDVPEYYSNYRLTEEMGFKDFNEYKISDLLKTIESVNERNLYRFYKKMLKEAELNIFVIGDVDVLEIEKVFEKNIKRTTNSNEKDFTVKHSRIRKRVKKFIETSNFNQSKLEFGLKMDNLTDFERQYVMYVYSNILGGGAESLLFNEVRTKKSLCYYIYSSGNGQKNLLQIRAGIDGKNTDKVINLVKKCLDRMKNGDFSDEDIMNAKKCYINTLTENEDYISATLASYSGNYYFDRDDNDIKKERINEVTKEDIINVSKKIHLDTIYVLKGESNEN